MSESGLICAFALNGKGGGETLDWSAVRRWKPIDGPLWLHLDYQREDSRRWLNEDSGLSALVREALLVDDPRPRSLQVDDGLVVIIRGINLNEGAKPEDMVSLRMWADEHRIITLRHRRLNAIKELRRGIVEGTGSTSTGDLLAGAIELVLSRIAQVVDRIDADVDHLEDLVLGTDDVELRSGLAALRRQAIGLRRFVAPQREVFSRLQSERVSWLDEATRGRLGESAERLLRTIEELDAAKERALVTTEELASRNAELINKRLYSLSIIAAVFLPLGFITSMLGVNLAGIPGTVYPWSFLIMCGAMVALIGFQLWLFRKMKWF
ncbi:MAG TPA: zinc transporter ZntB [Kofleriaceae bacterium]|nr:zinc transporter ZntB [Kofleriaceae bacterium]